MKKFDASALVMIFDFEIIKTVKLLYRLKIITNLLLTKVNLYSIE